jgi:integrase
MSKARLAKKAAPRLKTRFKIKEIKSGQKGTVFAVSGYLHGKQIRKRFDTRTRAEGFAYSQEIELLKKGDIKPRMTRLTEDELAIAEKAFGLLPEGGSLVDAARAYSEQWRPGKTQMRIGAALDLYEAEKRREGLRERSLAANLALLEKLPKREFCHAIGPERLRGIIGEGTPASMNTRRARLSGFFTWAKREGFCADNPVERIARVKRDQMDPEIFDLESVKAILRAGRDYKGGRFLAYFTLATFAAVRPEELRQLEWADIDFEDGILTIGGHIAKTRRKRLVELEPAALQWLELCRSRGLDLYPKKGFRRGMMFAKTLAGFEPDKHKKKEIIRVLELKPPEGKRKLKFKPWIRDGLRHTAISHHLALHGDENKTASWAGNSPNVINSHYRALVRKSEAQAFWAITPETIDENNLIELKEATR